MENNQIGKVCELCKIGLIIFVSIGVGLFGKKIEYICCSNKNCSAFINIRNIGGNGGNL